MVKAETVTKENMELTEKQLNLQNFIFEVLNPHAKKISFVAAMAEKKLGVSAFEAGGMIYMMCVTGQLEARGNILNWSYSEVALALDKPDD